MRKAIAAALKIGLFLIVWAAFYSPLLVPVARKFPVDQPFTRLYFELAGAVTILAAAWILLLLIDRRPFQSLGFMTGHAVRDVLAGIALGCAMMAVCVAILMVMGWALWLPLQPFSFRLLAIAAVAIMANTVTQEVLVRGYVQQTLDFAFGPRSAIVLSACFFTLLHAGVIRTLLPALNLFAAGVLLGVAYSMTRNLWLPIGIHFAWNFLQGPILGMRVSGQNVFSDHQMLKVDGPASFTGSSFGIEGGLVGLAVTVAGIAVIYSITRWMAADSPRAYPRASLSASSR